MKQSDLLTIFHHFGLGNQLDKLSEECGELKDAISISMQAYLQDSEKAIDTPSVITELADVAVMIAQFKLARPDIWEQVEAEAERKIDRTMDRIKSGFYEVAK